MTDTPQGPPPIPGEFLDMFEELIQYVEEARTIPLSKNVVLEKDDLIARLDHLKRLLPEELRAARWMVRRREAYKAENEEKARSILMSARQRADEMVAESSIVNEAVEEANRLVRNAEAEAARVRLEAEDLAEARLSEAETILGELLQEVRDARAELHRPQPAAPEPPISQ